MELNLTYYFLLFMIYSIAGWILEVTCKYIDYKRFINRGFLIGPYCPIYGYGAILITFLLYRYESDPIVLFFMTVFVCGTLEYATSWTMEKLFKARWWDYSKRKFNLDGRVCLGTLVPFGIFGMILTYITNPFLVNCLDKLNSTTLNIISAILFTIYIADNIISTVIIIGFRKTTIKIGKEDTQDNTEQITKKVREILSQKSWGYKRLINAFPKLETIKFKIKEITNEVKENVNEIKDNISEKTEDLKATINDKKEEVKNSISNTTESMKNTLTNTKNSFVNGIQNNTKKISVKLSLNKTKLKQRFFGKKSM